MVVLWVAIMVVAVIGLDIRGPRGRLRSGIPIYADVGRMVGYWVATCAIAGGLIYTQRGLAALTKNSVSKPYRNYCNDRRLHWFTSNLCQKLNDV